ncbi:MAG: HEAT repeat domain-containing protein [Planctomycetota bacterium]|jgi:hypothetical protein
MKRSCWALLVLAGAVGAGDAPEAEYTRRASAVGNSAEAHYRLALWCGEHRLGAYALRHHRAVVTLAPDHRAARRALGYEQVRGRWVKGEEAMRAKGFKEHDGAWVTPEEYRLLAKDEIAAGKAREARRIADEALKRAWNRDPAVRSRALAAIERLEAAQRLRPLSIAARINHPDVRLRAVEGLRALNDKEALPALYKRAIFDTEEAIRDAAVAAIKATDAEGKPGPFVRALNSPFDRVRIAAVKALGNLGDRRAVGPLVARYQVVGGSGQSVYISQMNQISFIQDFDVEVAQTSFIADPVIGVIQDGIVLNYRALSHSGYLDVYEGGAYAEALSQLTDKDLGNDAKAWLEWYRNERAEARRARARQRTDEDEDS